MSGSDLRAIARYVRRSENVVAGERCELCAAVLAEAHPHVVDTRSRRICCACPPCATLFSLDASAGGRYRSVPNRVLHDPALQLDETTWNGLGVPVRLAFFFLHSGLRRWIAIYPGPAGTTEAEPEPEGWAALGARTPLVAAVQPDVEALLVRGERMGGRFDLFLAPIAAAYELSARVRRSWSGFDGGPEVRRALDTFFDELRSRSRPWRSP
jgi:Family of unknown function (DUF5947)